MDIGMVFPESQGGITQDAANARNQDQTGRRRLIIFGTLHQFSEILKISESLRNGWYDLYGREESMKILTSGKTLVTLFVVLCIFPYMAEFSKGYFGLVDVYVIFMFFHYINVCLYIIFGTGLVICLARKTIGYGKEWRFIKFKSSSNIQSSTSKKIAVGSTKRKWSCLFFVLCASLIVLVLYYVGPSPRRFILYGLSARIRVIEHVISIRSWAISKKFNTSTQTEIPFQQWPEVIREMDPCSVAIVGGCVYLQYGAGFSSDHGAAISIDGSLETIWARRFHDSGKYIVYKPREDVCLWIEK